jgi:hypothetical protein
MNLLDNDPLYAAINAKLAAIVETSPTVPAWHDAWMKLGAVAFSMPHSRRIDS